MTDERFILCDGAVHACAPDEALRLAACGPGKTLALHIEGVPADWVANAPKAVQDLLRITAYIAVAERTYGQRSERARAREPSPHACLHFVVPVADPDLWNASDMLEALQTSLQLLSLHPCTFTFVPQDRGASGSLCLVPSAHKPMRSNLDGIDAIQLFSCEADAVVGAVQAFAHGRQRLVLVHRWSTTGMAAAETGRLCALHPMASPDAIVPIGIQVDATPEAGTSSHRPEPLLQVVLAGLVAQATGHERVHLYANGVTSLSLSHTGAQSAFCIAHPRVRLALSKLLSLACGRSVAIDNPFALKTPSEVVALLPEMGAEHLLRQTGCCTEVASPSAPVGPAPRRCGVCQPCIGRRFSVLRCQLEAHDPEEDYATHLIRGPWREGADRARLLAWIDAADRFASFDHAEAFMSGTPQAARAILAMAALTSCDVEALTERVFAMHKRHGEDVGWVLEKTMAALARAIRTPGTLSTASLPVLLFAHGQRGNDATPGPATTDPVLQVDNAYVFRLFGQHWTLRFRRGRAFSIKASKGMRYIHALLERPGETVDAFTLIDEALPNDPWTRPMTAPLGADEEALKSIKQAYEALTDQRDQAEALGHTEAVAHIDDEIEKLARYLATETGLMGKPRRENPEQKKARMAVTNAIGRALRAIGEINAPCARYLREQIKTGFFLKYRDTQIAWET